MTNEQALDYFFPNHKGAEAFEELCRKAGYDGAYLSKEHPRTYYLLKGKEKIKVIGRKKLFKMIGIV